MRTSAILYPYCTELLPFVRHFDQFQNQYSLCKLVSLSGLGLIGRDAAFACNHPEVGIRVEDTIDFSDPSWDVILLTRTLDAEVTKKSNLNAIAEKSLTAGKKVVWFDNRLADIPKKTSALFSANPSLTHIYASDTELPARNAINTGYCQLDAPVLLVGGLSTEADVFEVMLSIAAHMKTHGLHPTVFAQHPISNLFGFHSTFHIYNNRELTEAQKIAELNRFMKDCENTEHPDIVIIEAPDALLRFNDVAPNGFGIQSYMMVQAVRPDYCVCCVPCDLADVSLICALSNDFSIRLGTVINAVHVSNIIVDSINMLQTKEVSCVHSALSEVNKSIETIPADTPIPMFNVIKDGGSALYSVIHGSLQTSPI